MDSGALFSPCFFITETKSGMCFPSTVICSLRFSVTAHELHVVDDLCGSFLGHRHLHDLSRGHPEDPQRRIRLVPFQSRSIVREKSSSTFFRSSITSRSIVPTPESWAQSRPAAGSKRTPLYPAHITVLLTFCSPNKLWDKLQCLCSHFNPFSLRISFLI